MELLTEIWRRATGTQPAPSSTVVLATAVVAALVVALPQLWPLARHAITLVHEGSHATVAVLTGRRLAGIRLHSDTSGLTVSVGRPRGPGMVATAAAGYIGPGVLGLAAAWLTSRGHAVGVLWILLLLVALMLVQIRNWFGLWSVLVTGAALVAVTWWGSAQVQAASAYAITWFLLLGAPRPVLELLGRRSPGSDPALLARLTHVPTMVWILLLGAITVATAVVGGSLLIAAPLP
ncbi:M50 family metallopeptidase [Pengzhenrongella sicca]|uniref:M50 family metallopeptidase n=1 Tax=Pengzhenrongella sicca TaxID=2819238 RepID=A0A8A4ZE60_9MICO|nr:M50 family metallopeptidase [Pengzhenrongella sicca]QTE29691.1 M50 family metallopeptidase [Pengzhenrongella sicca]